MKRILFLTFCFFFSFINAQDDTTTSPKISFGIKAGLNSMHNKTVTNNSDNVQKKSGVYAGAFVTIHTSEVFSIQPELIYSSTEYISRNNVNLLHIPVLLQFNLGNKFLGYIGPEAQYLLNIDDAQNQDKFNDLLFGFTFGASYEVAPNFFIEARPYFAFTRFLDEDTGYRKFNTLQIGVGYRF